jgi:hypothetical protein
MLDLEVCDFPTISLKLSVTLSNFTKPDKATLRQEVKGFHMVMRHKHRKMVT